LLEKESKEQYEMRINTLGQDPSNDLFSKSSKYDDTKKRVESLNDESQ
jgi:hypothetical protein